MTFNNRSLITLYLVMLLFLAECYDTDLVIVMISLSLLYFFFKYGIYKRILVILLPLIVIPILGLIVAVFRGKYLAHDLLRDTYKTLCPIIFILFGFYLYDYSSKYKNLFYNSIYVAAFLISFRHFILLIINCLNKGVSFETIRGVGGNMSMTTLLAFVLVTYFNNQVFVFSYKKILGAQLVFGVSLMLYLSRTTIVVLLPFVLLFWMNKPKQISKNDLLGIIMIILTFFCLFFFFRNNPIIIELINKFSKTFTEINYNSNNWDWVSINNNWRGYEIYLVNSILGDSDIITKLFGFGYGALLPLGVTIKLGDGIFSEIPILHNGYFYILFKTGYVGMLLLILFLFFRMFKWLGCYLNMKKQENKKNALFLFCIYLAITTSMYVISGFYNGVTLLVLCEAVGYYERKISNNEK